MCIVITPPYKFALLVQYILIMESVGELPVQLLYTDRVIEPSKDGQNVYTLIKTKCKGHCLGGLVQPSMSTLY
jgi:hypothetical protein